MTNTAEKLTLPLFMVKYNGDLLISTGRSRFETSWKNKTMSWAALLNKLSRSMETTETHAEYMKMSKEQQDKIKDIGGFVGGHLRDGRRKTGYVTARQLLTLDLDFPPAEFWDNIIDNLEIDNALAVYSTHKHTKAKPRYRLIMPLDREVTPDEYEAIARKIAEKIGIDYFDDSTFQPTRLMYWPSHSVDVEPFFQYYDAPFLAADSILAEYPDWTDTSYWPESSRMVGIRKRDADRQGDPLEKKGPLGAFCRTYSITEAIAKFLPDVYTPTAKEDRYTYAAGSTAAGLVIYDGDVFAYSNHSTDPAGGRLCNAFDLVRIHKFGHLDEGKEDKAVNQLPSQKAMYAFANEDPGVSLTLANDRKSQQVLDFEGVPLPDDIDDSWKTKLVRGENGDVKPLITNAVLILENEPALQGIRYNELSNGIEVKGKLPWPRPNKYWRDVDDAHLYTWVADTYGVQFPESRFSKALSTVADKRRFNPLREYIQALPEWDGVSRVDTLLIDYLGAEDSTYTRAVTRKTLVGAVQRVLQPGRKFDWVGSYLPIIVPQWFGQGFFIFLNIQFIKGIPMDLDEAARMDGCSTYTIFFRIILPLIKPSLVTSAIFSFMWRWDDFLAALLYLSDPLKYPVSYALKMFSDPTAGSDWGAMFAMATLSLIPIFVIFLTMQKYLVEGIASTGIKG